MQSLNILNTYCTDNYSVDFIPETYELPAQAGQRLMEELQTSIDLTKICEIFSSYAKKIYDFCALTFINDDFHEGLSGNSRGKFHHAFEIEVEGMQVGRLVYQSNHSLSSRSELSLNLLHKVLSYPLRNALMYRQAMRMATQDILTGLGNRAAFDKQLDLATKRCQRNNSDMTLMLFDLNKFKAINDTHGHYVGDQVLCKFAKALKRSVRSTDSCYRFGGDEFAVLVEESTAKSKKVILKRFKEALSKCELLSKYQVSSSVGSANYKNNEELSELFIRADRNLYKNKANR